MKIKKLSIIIPVYNEEGTIGRVIKEVKKLKLPIEKEIIVVDDGSADRSFERIKRLKGIKILRHEKNKGKGAAVKTALRKVTGEIVLIQDADLELDPAYIPALIKPILENKAQVVFGSRNASKKGACKDRGRDPIFYLGSILVSVLTNLLYGTKITDEYCGYKAFKTDLIKSIKINNDRFEWEAEITIKITKKKIPIYEVPIVSKRSRTAKEGKKLKKIDGLKAIMTIVKYRFKD